MAKREGLVGFKSSERAREESRRSTTNNVGVVQLNDGSYVGRGDRFTDGSVSLFGAYGTHMFSTEARELGLIE